MPQLFWPWYRSPKGHRSRKQLAGRLGCALLAMLQDFTDFPCSHGIGEFQIFEPKPVNFKPVGLKGVSGMQQSRSLHCFGDNPAASAAHFTQTFQCQRVEGERRRDDILSADFVWQT